MEPNQAEHVQELLQKALHMVQNIQSPATTQRSILSSAERDNLPGPSLRSNENSRRDSGQSNINTELQQLFPHLYGSRGTGKVGNASSPSTASPRWIPSGKGSVLDLQKGIQESFPQLSEAGGFELMYNEPYRKKLLVIPPGPNGLTVHCVTACWSGESNCMGLAETAGTIGQAQLQSVNEQALLQLADQEQMSAVIQKKVSCPTCNGMFLLNTIEQHADSCCEENCQFENLMSTLESPEVEYTEQANESEDYNKPRDLKDVMKHITSFVFNAKDTRIDGEDVLTILLNLIYMAFEARKLGQACRRKNNQDKMVKHCYYKQCNNDSRRPNAPTMKNRYGEYVKFLHFLGKVRNTAKARLWMHACYRPCKSQCLHKLTYMHFICSLHFNGENVPTDRYPDPVPESLSRKEREELEHEFNWLRKRAD
eukprot:gene8556-9471_t